MLLGLPLPGLEAGAVALLPLPALLGSLLRGRLLSEPFDRRVKLIMSAEVEPEALYTEGPLVHEFPRTVSRLREMRSADFLAEARRNVDTSLT